MTTPPTHQIDPHLFVVLGGTSDLMRRKLLPAIYRLRAERGRARPPDHPGGVPAGGTDRRGLPGPGRRGPGG